MAGAVRAGDTEMVVIDEQRRRNDLGISQRHPMRETGLLVADVAHGPAGFEFGIAYTVEMDERLNALQPARRPPSALGHRVLRS